MPDPIKPTAADREAAASAYYAWIGSNPVIPRKMTAGEADGHSMVQAFALHAQQAREQALEVAGVTSFVTLEWWAAPRPPVHPNKMRGKQSFKTFDDAVRFMAKQAADAEFISLTQTFLRDADRSDDAIRALKEQPPC